MSVLTIRLPDDQHERLKALAAHRGVSMNKLVEELATRAVAEFDTEVRFRARAARGDAASGLALLDKLNAAFEGKAQGTGTGMLARPVGRRDASTPAVLSQFRKHGRLRHRGSRYGCIDDLRPVIA